ncbi:MAG: hypothetical protein JWN25_193, partial [Verrucomicrobiales bacterium]|nr:hypothetical protein [Verrucomicrobiales bacterium]
MRGIWRHVKLGVDARSLQCFNISFWVASTGIITKF